MKLPGNDLLGARSFLSRLKDRLGLKNLALVTKEQQNQTQRNIVSNHRGRPVQCLPDTVCHCWRIAITNCVITISENRTVQGDSGGRVPRLG